MDLQFTSVRKDFGASQVLDIPSFDLSAGSQCAVMGDSGVGKTTFLNLIAGILLPTSGDIRLGETSLPGLSERARDAFRARHIGYVFQTFNLLPELSVLENIRLSLGFAGKSLTEERLRGSLDRIGLGAKAHASPGTLSIGQRQRVAVVRALVHGPAIILADEPTGALDQKNKAATLELIRELCGEAGSSLLLVTHDPWVAGRFPAVLQFADLNRAARP
jgi:ABC-type lipoprotein export system ATPase subunit